MAIQKGPSGALGTSIEAGEIATGAITEDKIGSGAVTENKIGSGAVTENKIGSGAVTASKIESDIALPGTSATINGYTPTMSNMAGRNRIINGAMVFDQRNAGASSAPAGSSGGTYTLDRWVYQASATGKFTVQQNAGSVTPPAGFSKYLGLTVASAVTVGSTDYFNIYQVTEANNVSDLAWGTSSAANVTLSFWVRSSLTGTFGGSLRNGAVNRTYPFNYTISSANTWEKKSITIAGDVSGTWATDNSQGIYITWSLGVGSTYSGGTVNTWNAVNYQAPSSPQSVVGTSGATFYITGVQLEAGSVATPFEHRQYGQELALCQRYYETGLVGFVGTVTSGHAAGTAVPFAVTKRTTPTMSQAASLNASGFGSGVGSYFVTGADGVAVYHTATVTGNCSWVDRYIAAAEL